jgi:hypothetical protein
MEPISPELALVDPELRRAAIASLDPHAFDFAPAQVRAIPTVAIAPPRASRSWPRRAAQFVLLVGLLVAGIVVANVAARNGAQGPVLLTSSTFRPAPSQTSAQLHGRASIEQQLLELVIQSPATRLPAALVDSRTGLARNNLQAVCHPAAAAGRYSCIVRPALHRPGEGMVVRYGPDGFTWYPYRAGRS